MTIFSKILAAGIAKVLLGPSLEEIEKALKKRRKKRAKATAIENLPQEVLEKMPEGFRLLALMAYREGHDFSYDAEKDIVVLSDPLISTDSEFLFGTRFAFDPKTGQSADDKLPPAFISGVCQ